MEMGPVRIALVSIVNEDRDFYQQMMARHAGIVAEPYVSIDHLRRECRGQKYNGIVIDIVTAVCASTAEKDFLFSMQQGLPLLQVRRGAEEGENGDAAEAGGIACVVNREAPSQSAGFQLFDHFLETVCRQGPARGIRLDARRLLRLQLHLFGEDAGEGLPVETVNLSLGGCRLVSAAAPAGAGHFWLAFDALYGQPPIAARVCWRAAGETAHLGVSFDDLTPLQQVGIVGFLHAAAAI